jgi:hypothetical protein
MSGGSTAFHLLPFVVTEEPLSKSNTGMGFRARRGRPRANGRRCASRNKEVQIPRRWHRRCCRAPQDHRPGQLGSRSALAAPWTRLVSNWTIGPSGALFARARCSFYHHIPVRGPHSIKRNIWKAKDGANVVLRNTTTPFPIGHIHRAITTGFAQQLYCSCRSCRSCASWQVSSLQCSCLVQSVSQIHTLLDSL